MKIATPDQMAHLENIAYQEGHQEAVFMEEAGSGVGLIVHEYVERFGLEHQVILICGKGNNAGDAYVAGSHLLLLDYHVHAYQLFPLAECSPLCQQNAHRFAKEGGTITEVQYGDEVPFLEDGIIIDGIFGTGFRGEVEEPIKSIIASANASGLPILSIDIPSGLDGETGVVQGEAIEAAQTAFLGLPKLGFFIRDGWNKVGKLKHVDFGLPREIIEDFTSQIEMLSIDFLLPFLPKVIRNRSKYEAGYVVALAGSPGMSGAAYLSSMSALRSGAGIVRLLYPDGMQAEMASSPWELVKTAYDSNNSEDVLAHINRASAVYIGPGMGRSPTTFSLLKNILPYVEVPCVIDADALNIIAEENLGVPEEAILTPHLGELYRLLGLTERQPLDLDFLKRCQNYAEEKRIILVVKGGPTFIFQRDKATYVNPVGDPGMATAGSGDVLTGLIAGLLSQGVPPHGAACLGVYLHGLAGEAAAEERTPFCMTASDLIGYFPEAFTFSWFNLS
ncbi:Bifunctional NAD(P)H-hydrate repair enzyme Nnr [Chlamydiales bacterium STE3]|nr:Bifunctional NAD(P)H-hydrate repair enzyme Nnr [Chlamydiales bacterium STE3]